MKVSTINIQYNDQGEVETYIMAFTIRKESISFDGQMKIPASEADLSNVIDVAKKKITDLVNQEQPE